MIIKKGFLQHTAQFAKEPIKRQFSFMAVDGDGKPLAAFTSPDDAEMYLEQTCQTGLVLVEV